MQMSPPPSSFGGFARNLLIPGFFLKNQLRCFVNDSMTGSVNVFFYQQAGIISN